MNEPTEQLSAAQVRDAGLQDWRQILGRIKARFHTGDFRTGLALINQIGAAAEAAGDVSTCRSGRLPESRGLRALAGRCREPLTGGHEHPRRAGGLAGL